MTQKRLTLVLVLAVPLCWALGLIDLSGMLAGFIFGMAIFMLAPVVRRRR